MDNQRGREIASSPIMANVTYRDNQIYIEKVNTNKHTANIHYLNNPDRKLEVSLDNLVEHEQR